MLRSFSFYWWKLYATAICLSLTSETSGLDNGVALRPPMGWMTWQRFRCITDCETYPDECISERLVKRTADLMVEDGYLEAGYEYLIVDDCWLARNRTAEGNLEADPSRFPNGMKAVADYVHSKGLKFGIYEDYGDETCAGFPGLYGHIEKDIQLLVDWGIDYIKVDGCNDRSFNATDYTSGYQFLKETLNKTGRPVVFSCSYPAYIDPNEIDFQKLTENCNLWRYYIDIDDSWDAVTSILNYVADKQDTFGELGGVGHWNDPDMLIIGNYGLSYEQSKTQMALWAIQAAPLLMSVDLATIRPEHRRILQNKKVIQINQDPLGIQGRRVYKAGDYEVWTRKVVPVVYPSQYSYAIALCSRRTDGALWEFSTTLSSFGLNNSNGYKIENIYTGQLWSGIYKPNDILTARIPPSGVVFLKAIVVR